MTWRKLMLCPSCQHERECESRYDVMPGGLMCDECCERRPRVSHAEAAEVPVASTSGSFVAEVVPSSSSLSLSHEGVEKNEEKYGDALIKDVASGVLEPVAVKLRNVPEDASSIVRRVVEDFEMVSGARLAVGDDRPVPYACRWPAGRLGASSATVNRVLLYLVERGALEAAGEMPGRGARGTKLYAPAAAVRHLRRVA